MRKLGLDLGIKSCGFAITDENEIISTSLENFLMNEGDFNAVIKRIEQYLQEYKIDGFVLGYPLKISGEKSDRTLMVEDFKKLLEENFQIPVMLVNEQYSTKKAQQVMISAGLTRKKRKANKDKLAAQIILQDYLEYYQDKWGKNE
ncbi:Holliday junction resolvase RuvX [Mycoplasmopsis columboralis]|uniref:Putative pre-16S rRNA nuclease n=1 Tax=Mycoplasmopsis columboralis TaxID=171282 RepID=A0A449B6B3_9BACT|nr:Holliday junction resolvase RuvX [Mycoplasmopsis columboralis]VEU76119.1 Putative Holliday junction resolvase [Mycoplasmopsis columboralis]